jgi:hypothetical protein
MLNGTSIAASEVIRDSLEATLTNVEAGYHTLRFTMGRGATNTRAIYQFIDDIRFTAVAPASTQAVPEPSAAALLCVALAFATPYRRRRAA